MEFRRRARLFEANSLLEKFRPKTKPKDDANIMIIKTRNGEIRQVNSNGDFVTKDINKVKKQRKHAQVFVFIPLYLLRVEIIFV